MKEEVLKYIEKQYPSNVFRRYYTCVSVVTAPLIDFGIPAHLLSEVDPDSLNLVISITRLSKALL